MKQYLTYNQHQLGKLSAPQIADYALLLGQLSLEELNQLEPDAVRYVRIAVRYIRIAVRYIRNTVKYVWQKCHAVN